jgi:hypothetical protein
MVSFMPQSLFPTGNWNRGGGWAPELVLTLPAGGNPIPMFLWNQENVDRWIKYVVSRVFYRKIICLEVLLLCNDRQIDRYSRAVSRQRIGKHVPVATDRNATMVQQMAAP